MIEPAGAETRDEFRLKLIDRRGRASAQQLDFVETVDRMRELRTVDSSDQYGHRVVDWAIPQDLDDQMADQREDAQVVHA